MKRETFQGLIALVGFVIIFALAWSASINTQLKADKAVHMRSSSMCHLILNDDGRC